MYMKVFRWKFITFSRLCIIHLKKKSLCEKKPSFDTGLHTTFLFFNFKYITFLTLACSAYMPVIFFPKNKGEIGPLSPLLRVYIFPSWQAKIPPAGKIILGKNKMKQNANTYVFKHLLTDLFCHGKTGCLNLWTVKHIWGSGKLC